MPEPTPGVEAGVRTTLVEHGPYRTRVVTRGPRSGPHAIVLPGLAATARTLAPQLRLLRCLGYTTHVLELPGFGAPPALRIADAHIPQLAGYVLEAAHALGIERALLLGHSLGGGVALYVARQRPDLVERLVLLAPAAVGDSLLWTYRLFCVPLVGRALLRPHRRGGSWYTRAFLLGSARREDHHFVDSLVRTDEHSAAKARSMRAVVWANQPRLRARLARLLAPGGEQSAFTLGGTLSAFADVPTLVLWGSEDRVILARDATVFRAEVPSAEVHVVRGVGHLLPLEAPRWVNAHVARFLAYADLGRAQVGRAA